MSQTKPATNFQGFRSPHYTQVPDELFDELLSQLAGAELKVLLYIIRRTFGFKKSSEHISLSQIRHGITTRDGRVLDRGTGLSLSATQNAIKALITKSVIAAQRNRSAERGDEATTYRLRLLNAGDTGMEPPRSAPDTGKRQGGIPMSGSGGDRKSVAQETVSKQTAIAIRTSKAALTPGWEKAESDLAGDGRGTPSPLVQTAPPTTSQTVRTHETHSLADVLKNRQLPPVHNTQVLARTPATMHRAPTPQIVAVVAEISQELGDGGHLRANTTQAVHVWEVASCSEAMLVSRLYEARSITRQQPRVVNRKSYFWAVLRDLLGISAK